MLLDKDSFDYYTTLSQRWQAAGAGLAVSAGNGRRGTASIRATQSRAGAYRVLPSAKSELVLGVAVKMPNPGPQQGAYVFAFGNSLNPAICLGIDTASGQLFVNRNGPRLGTRLLTTTYVYTWGDTVYIELKGLFSTTVGEVEVRVNEVSHGSATGLNMGANSISQYCLGAMDSDSLSFSWTPDFDDFYLCDTSGSVNNDFLGDIRVDALLPDGAGSSADWSRGGADSGANWSQVEEVPPNDDTDYVAASTPGDVDLYTFDDLASPTGDVFAVCVNYRSKKDDAGSRVLTSQVKSGSSTDDGANYAPGTSYASTSDIFELNPDTSSAWTISEVNGLEAGPKVIT